jgi:hypothetical protein
MMANTRLVQRGSVVLALVVGLAVGMGPASCSAPVTAQSAGRYEHFHFRAGGCRAGGVQGQGIIDRRNGNAWCVPFGSEAPAYEGTLNLAAVPEQAPR